MQRADSLEKALILGKTEGKRRRGQHRTSWLNGITDSVNIKDTTQAHPDGSHAQDQV